MAASVAADAIFEKPRAIRHFMHDVGRAIGFAPQGPLMALPETADSRAATEGGNPAK